MKASSPAPAVRQPGNASRQANAFPTYPHLQCAGDECVHRLALCVRRSCQGDSRSCRHAARAAHPDHAHAAARFSARLRREVRDLGAADRAWNAGDVCCGRHVCQESQTSGRPAVAQQPADHRQLLLLHLRDLVCQSYSTNIIFIRPASAPQHPEARRQHIQACLLAAGIPRSPDAGGAAGSSRAAAAA